MNLTEFQDRFLNRTANQNATEEGDFGLGDKVARKPGTRLIREDGEFNVTRRGRPMLAPYQNLVEMGWWQFLFWTTLTYVVLNVLFALGFFWIGVDELSNIDPAGPWHYRLLHCFYFSTQTFTTVGYGTISPVGPGANVLASFLAYFGWVALAIMTGLFFARFSRPGEVIIFSEKVLIAPYEEGLSSLQFRIANRRNEKLINLAAQVVLTWLVPDEGTGKLKRYFSPLALERDMIALFPLNWTIVHPITEDSPLRTWEPDDFERKHAELLVMVEGYDQTFAQNVHVKRSYIHGDIQWNARFEPMYREREHMTELFLDCIDHYAETEERIGGVGEEEE